MGNFKAFGRSYSSIGESDSDFLIKTKGQVKIQWGNKFIDLIKNGKINVETSFIFKEDSVGEKDGIYVIEDDQSVWLVVNGEQINLKGETGNTYVSFLAPQEVTLEQKYQALQNIGFIYPTISDANSYNIQNGIIYIEETQKLYIIINGSLTEYTAKLPNPVTEQFVIAKNDSKQGAILIKGEGIENSLAFNSFYLYSEFGISYIQSDDPLFIKFGDFKAIQIDNEKSIFNNSIVCDEIRSKVSDNSKGFHIYYINGESFLEVDNLIVRNSQENYSLIYPEFILGEINVIKSVKFVNSKELEINLQYVNNFEINDILTTINTINVIKYNQDYLNTLTTYNELEPILIELELLVSGNTYYTTDIDQIKLDIIEAQSVYATISNFELTVTNVKEQIISITSNIELEESISNILINQLIFKKTSFDGTLPIRIKDSNIDIIEYEQTISDPGKGRQSTVKTRFGNLSELNIKETDSGSDVDIIGSGIYSEQGYFKKASYVKGYSIPDSDNSSKFASTEWVKKLITNQSSSNLFNKCVNNVDWGNSLNAPGLMTYKLDSNKNIIEDDYIDNLYYSNVGTSYNWSIRDWQVAFLQHSLSYFLQKNNHKYNETGGWNFELGEIISSSGYGGSWTARVGEIIQIEENINEINSQYYNTSTLSSLCGKVIGNGGIVHFEFKNVILGKLRTDLGIGYLNSIIGSSPIYTDCLYEIDFERCNYIYESF